jgi:hypothetical protein
LDLTLFDHGLISKNCDLMEFNGIINNGDTLSGFNHLLWIMDEHIPDDLNVKHGDFQFATLNNQRVTITNSVLVWDIHERYLMMYKAN